MTDAAPEFVAPRWYLRVLWPLLAVMLVGVVCLGIVLFHLIHGLFAPGIGPAPKPLLTVGIVCLGGGGVLARILQMTLAIQKDRWSRAHGGADPDAGYRDVTPHPSDDAAVESLGLHFSEPDDEEH